jgi:glycosyltransferase involved in cell wall biosynthesis
MSALTVALDYRPALHHAFGIGRYVRNLVPALLDVEPQLQLRLYGVFLRQRKERIRQHVFPASSRATFHSAPIPARLVPLLGRWTPLHSGWFTGPADLFHDTDYISTPTGKTPRVATLYDTAWMAHRGFVSRQQARVMESAVRSILRGVRHVITISESAKSELVEHLGLDPAGVTVTPLGVEPAFFATPDFAATEAVLARLNLERPFGVNVGVIEPRKNIHRLLRAFRRLVDEAPEQRLVLVGRPGHGHERIMEELARLELVDSVLTPGILSDADLVALLHGADWFAYPSLHEGFGLPTLEAMAAGVPTLSSNTTSLAEVCGDGALLVNPEDEVELSAGLRRIACDRCEALEFAARGRARARLFTWEETAKATLSAWRKALA